jgi:hypothetical protein
MQEKRLLWTSWLWISSKFAAIDLATCGVLQSRGNGWRIHNERRPFTLMRYVTTFKLGFQQQILENKRWVRTSREWATSASKYKMCSWYLKWVETWVKLTLNILWRACCRQYCMCWQPLLGNQSTMECDIHAANNMALFTTVARQRTCTQQCRGGGGVFFWVRSGNDVMQQ